MIREGQGTREGYQIPMMTGPRLVLNHSTHLPGLISILKKISLAPRSWSLLRTIIPGRIYKCKPRVGPLEIRFTTTVKSSSKALVRTCSEVQEIFFVCKGQADTKILVECFKDILKKEDIAIGRFVRPHYA